jgi:predicted DsbA family dithiol-disulfide isomerase
MINPQSGKTSRPDETGARATLQVDIIADFVCPWCYVGKRRLDEALLAVHGPSIVTWYPYQLNPAIPPGGVGLEEYLASHFADRETLQPLLAELATTGNAGGIQFNFDRIKRIPNTLNAHRLMQLADTEGVGVSTLAESIFRGFFEEGVDISQREVLVELGARCGLSPRSIDQRLDDEVSRRTVLAQEAQIRRGGVTRVPDFLVNKRLFVPGAQNTKNLVNVFDRAMFGEESDRPVSPVVH